MPDYMELVIENSRVGAFFFIVFSNAFHISITVIQFRKKYLVIGAIEIVFLSVLRAFRVHSAPETHVVVPFNQKFVAGVSSAKA